jgi:hypothetical protein
MGNLKVPVYHLGRDFNYQHLGEITLEEGDLRANPPENRDLQRIIKTTYRLGTSTKIQEFNPDKDPEEWMKNLHKRYCTQHILMGKVKSFEG